MQSCMQDAGMKQEAAAYLQEREQNAAYEFFSVQPGEFSSWKAN